MFLALKLWEAPVVCTTAVFMLGGVLVAATVVQSPENVIHLLKDVLIVFV